MEIHKIYEYIKKLSESPLLFWVNKIWFCKGSPFYHSIRGWITYNTYKNRIISKIENDNFFEKGILFFEVYNRCNARCIFCSYKKIKRSGKPSAMEFNIFKKVIDDYISYGGANNKTILFCASGSEALLDKGIYKKIKYAKEKGLKVEMVTNGVLLDYNNNYKKLINSNIDRISISISDFDSKIESEVYGIPEKLATKKIDGILKLMDYNSKYGNTKITLEFRPVRKPWELKNHILFKKIVDYSVQYSFLLAYSNWSGIISNKDLRGIMSFRDMSKFRKVPCMGIFVPMVCYNGDVELCGCIPHDGGQIQKSLRVGNILNDSLYRIMTSEKSKKLRSGFLYGKYPIACKNCSLYWPMKKIH
jgi:MoaA/NifB/PqqE/SkfB family radical SAM enzyme